MIIPRPCDNCQVEYQAEERYLRRGQGRYCSQSCATINYHKNLPRPESNVICATCNKEFYRQPSHLNSKSGLYFCCKEHQDEGYRKDIVVTIPRKTRPNRKPTIDEMIVLWLGGDNSVTLSSGRNKETKSFVKKYLVATRGAICEGCGFEGVNPHTGNSIIQMDHADGNCFNNDPSNLRLLCPNCHAMTPTYGSLNKGSGRAHRRKSVV